jgi:hypothetical protein
MNNIQPPNPRNNEIEGKPLHTSAITRIMDSSLIFAITLILQGKIQAHKDKAVIVLSKHVDESLDFVFQQKKKDWWKEGLKIVGGAFLGAFIPGLITSIPAHDTIGIIIYIVLGFVGMLAVNLGIFL